MLYALFFLSKEVIKFCTDAVLIIISLMIFVYLYKNYIFCVSLWLVCRHQLGGCAPIRGLHKVISSRRPTTTHNQLSYFTSCQLTNLSNFPSCNFDRLVYHSQFSWLSSIKLAMFFIENIRLIMRPGLVLIKSSSLKVGLEARAGGILQCEI